MKQHRMFQSLVTRHSSLVTALAFALVSAPAGAETVQIASAADWADFANRVNGGASALCAEMTADVTLGNDAPRAGTDTHRWSGTFDGGGHTLTVDWTFAGDSSSSPAAPFAVVDGCSIHDLRVAGSIVTDGTRASGFVGHARINGNVTIERCVSSVAITCTKTGDATSAGFVGCTDYGRTYTVSFTDCLFDGSLLGQNASCFGGFVGQRFSDATVRLANCAFAPAAVEVSDNDSFTFVRNGSTSASYSTCYYTRTLGAAQGTDASAMSVEDLAAALGSKWTVANGKAMLAEFAAPASPPAPMPAGFAYQGLLRDAQGNALSPGERNKTVEFRLYSQASGGEPLWGRSQPVLLDDNGLFVVEISDAAGTALGDAAGTNLASVLASGAGTSLYLGLTVAEPDAAEIAPRQRLVPVPFATIASDATGASGDFAVAGAATAGGATVSGLLDARSLSVSGGATASSVAVAGSIVSGDGTIPLGGIIPWSGATTAVPDGWALCNGQTVNGRKTPDLRDRFVVGAGGEYQPNATGGVARVTLTVEQMPAHTHDYKFTGADLALSWDNDNYFYDASREYPNNTNTKTTESRGGNQPHENRPPYYALCYIMRVR